VQLRPEITVRLADHVNWSKTACSAEHFQGSVFDDRSGTAGFGTPQVRKRRKDEVPCVDAARL
jgi:hypothetical protein